MGRNNKRIDSASNESSAPKKKGTSYQRKQKEYEKGKDLKYPKRFKAPSDSKRAKSDARIKQYMLGNYDPDDDF